MNKQETESFDKCMLELIKVRKENAALKAKVAELTTINKQSTLCSEIEDMGTAMLFCSLEAPLVYSRIEKTWQTLKTRCTQLISDIDLLATTTNKQSKYYIATVLVTLDRVEVEQKLYFLEFPGNIDLMDNPTIEKMVREAFLDRMGPMIKACATDKLRESVRKSILEAKLLSIEPFLKI